MLLQKSFHLRLDLVYRGGHRHVHRPLNVEPSTLAAKLFRFQGRSPLAVLVSRFANLAKLGHVALDGQLLRTTDILSQLLNG